MVSTQTNRTRGRKPPLDREEHALRDRSLRMCALCVCTNAWSHEAEQHWGPKAASESFCRAVLRACVAGERWCGVAWCGVVWSMCSMGRVYQ